MTTDRVADFASVFGVPPEVGAVVREFRSCEFSTLARDGTPVTWPTMPLFEPANRRFLITTSIGLAQKAFNVRRDGRVAMLFSNPTGSGLVSPPLVLIQGDANAPEDLTPPVDGFVERAQLLFERQPVGITMIGVHARSGAKARGLVWVACLHSRAAAEDPLVAERLCGATVW